MESAEARPPSGWRKLSGHALIYVGSAALNALFPFLLLPLLTRWLGPSEFGIVAAFLAATNLSAVIVGLSTHGLISVKFFREGPHTLPLQTGAAIGVAGIMSCLMALTVLLTPESLVDETGLPRLWLWVVVLTALGQFIMSVTLGVYQTRRQPYRFAAMQLGFGLSIAVLAILLIGVWNLGWTGRALAQTIAAVTIGAAGLVSLTLAGALTWQVKAWPIRSSLAFGLPLLPHVLGAAVITTVDRFALTSTEGAEALGHYYLAAQIGSLFVVTATAISQAWQPWLFEQLARDTQYARRNVVRATYAILGLLTLGAAMITLLSPYIVPVIAGPGFAPTVGLLQILGPAFACMGMYFFFTGFLFYEQRTGLQSAITVVAATFQTALTFYMASALGATGVAYATLISFASYWLMTWAAAHFVHPMPWFRLGIAHTHGNRDASRDNGNG